MAFDIAVRQGHIFLVQTHSLVLGARTHWPHGKRCVNTYEDKYILSHFEADCSGESCSPTMKFGGGGTNFEGILEKWASGNRSCKWLFRTIKAPERLTHYHHLLYWSGMHCFLCLCQKIKNQMRKLLQVMLLKLTFCFSLCANVKGVR